MSIKETLEKIKPYYPVLLIIVISAIFFGLGRISAINKESQPIKIDYPATGQTGSVISSGVATATKVSEPAQNSSNQDAGVIGSKSGKKYYFPWCGTVKRIKSENQVHFTSIDEAKKAGFTPGGNCKGLQ